MPFLALIGLLAIIPLGMIYGTWAWAIVTKDLWLWFFVPTFHVDPINFQQAVALGIGMGLLHARSSLHNQTPKNKEGETDWATVWGTQIVGIFAPWLVLFGAWFIRIIFIG